MIIITVPKTTHMPYDTVPFTVKEVIYKSVDGKYVLPIDAITGETIQPKIKHEGIDFHHSSIRIARETLKEVQGE